MSEAPEYARYAIIAHMVNLVSYEHLVMWLAAGNLLAPTSSDLVYLDFGMMSEAPEYARYAIIAQVVNLVSYEYLAMCQSMSQVCFLQATF